MSTARNEAWEIAGASLTSRLFLGTAGYPSPETLLSAIAASGTEVVTVSLRRETSREHHAGQTFWQLVARSGARVLPNTAGCRSVKEAIQTAHLARELFATTWLKLEVTASAETLEPDPLGLVEAARILTAEGFEVFPYTTESLALADRLAEVGCRILMPWGAPIGTAQGIRLPDALAALRARFPELAIIVDAGLGRPSHAAAALELGADAVLVNTAVAKAQEPSQMAAAFAQAVMAGRLGYHAGWLKPRDLAVPSTPVEGTPFWHDEAYHG